MSYRVLITGSRWFGALNRMRAMLRRELKTDNFHDIVFVHGGASGADTAIEMLVKEGSLPGATTEVHEADWSQGRKAGPTRNQAMVDLGADICFAFPVRTAENKGTIDCITRCIKAGIPVTTYPTG